MAAAQGAPLKDDNGTEEGEDVQAVAQLLRAYKERKRKCRKYKRRLRELQKAVLLRRCTCGCPHCCTVDAAEATPAAAVMPAAESSRAHKRRRKRKLSRGASDHTLEQAALAAVEEARAQAAAAAAAPGDAREPQYDKLVWLTGRRSSVEQIAPLLVARTPEEAKDNAGLLKATEHMKRVYGERPRIGSEIMSQDEDFGRRDANMEKLARLTGRRGSLGEIDVLLAPQTPEEAVENAHALRKMEHLKKRFGARPLSFTLERRESLDKKKLRMLATMRRPPPCGSTSTSSSASSSSSSDTDDGGGGSGDGHPRDNSKEKEPDEETSRCTDEAVEGSSERRDP
eukprot:TRINITY_DN285_c0_g3_i2.p1 TRINITY_DN285_c0_g3~~TRINITY_DN285_c0_g3_i2.p1  ORF type:complete len:341 (+),score=95.91 TRINITY_DN285_c0_g3_i2:184-1206(+)